MATDLDAPVIAVGRLVNVAGLPLALEVDPHVFGERRPIVLEGEQVVGHRAAQDDQQDFREGVDNLSGLTGGVERGKMIKKRLLLHRRPR